MAAEKPIDMDRETEINDDSCEETDDMNRETEINDDSSDEADDLNRETEINGKADDYYCEEADDDAEMRENGTLRQGNFSNGHQSAPLLKSTQQTITVQKSHVKKGCTLQLFIANMSLVILFYMFMMVYGSGVIRTMERRFGLRSSQTGLMQSANDIIHVCLVVFIGYFGRKAHKPRIICVTVLFSALAGFMMASPHFFISSKLDTVYSRPVNTTNVSSLLSKTSKGFCLNWNTSGDAISGDQCEQIEHGVSQMEVHPAYYVFLLAGFINGIGGSGLHTLSLAYIDENSPGSKSSLYIGIFTSMYAIGPMGGMMLAAVTLRLPENLFSPVEGNPSDASWIGCWWLGYVICGTGILATAIPLWFFPKSCSEKATIANQKEKDKLAEESSASDEKTISVARREILEFPRRLLHLLRNKAYVVNLFSVVCGGYVMIGIFANLVRYIEIHFLERAFVGSLIAGVVMCLSGSIGGFLGGLLMNRLKLRPPGAVKVIIFSSTCFATGLVIILFLQCPQLQMAGQIDPEENRFTVITECNHQCACSTSRKSYAPVCGSDNLTYFSACTAGCRSFVNGTYSDCGCIGSGGVEGEGGVLGGIGEEGWARPGLCLPPCNLLIPFAVTLFIMGLLGSFARVPSTIVNFRIVDDDERSIALSINSFAINLLAFVPAPLLYGSLIDSACILWQTTCKKTGGCLLFNTDRFRYVTYGLALLFTVIDILLGILLFVFVRKMVFHAADTDKKLIVLDAEEERLKEKLQSVETTL